MKIRSQVEKDADKMLNAAILLLPAGQIIRREQRWSRTKYLRAMRSLFEAGVIYFEDDGHEWELKFRWAA